MKKKKKNQDIHPLMMQTYHNLKKKKKVIKSNVKIAQKSGLLQLIASG